MPNKTKETKKEIVKETEKVSQVPEKNEIKKAKKKNTSAKEIAVKVAETIKEASKKIIGSKEKNEKKPKKASVKSEKSSSTRKTKKATEEPITIETEKTSKKASKETTSSTKKTNTKSSTTAKKSVAKKEANKPKNITISKVKNVKATYKSAKAIKPKPKAKKATKKPVSVIENYELPYRYNETIVRILYQTPNTLFVYWDMSDKDRQKYIKQFGEDFFNNSYPVLIIHNDTMNYSFEIKINDFANSWYLRVNDSKCNYRVELGRRLSHISNNNTNTQNNNSSQNFHNDYVYVSMSNSVELPNDHILFKTNENNTIKYRNVKTKQETNISIFDIIKNLPLIEKTEIPYLSSEILEGLYTAIYKNEDLSVLEALANPSSRGLESSRMPHSK